MKKTFCMMAIAVIAAVIIAPCASWAEATEKDIPGLVSELTAGGPQASQAADELAGIGAGAIPALLGAIKEGRSSNEAVIVVLNRVMNPGAAEVVEGYVNDLDSNVRDTARNLLQGLGEAAMPFFIGMMGRPETHDAATDILMRFKLGAKSIEALRAQLKSGNPLSRGAAALVLGYQKDEDSAEAIKALMADDDPAARTGAARGYYWLFLDKPEGYDIDAVMARFSDPEPAVRVAATSILNRVNNEKTTAALLGRLGVETDHEALSQAVNALADRGATEAAFPLIKLLDVNDQDKTYQGTVIWALGVLKAKEAVPYIHKFIEGDALAERVTRGESFEALGSIGEPVGDFGPYLKYLEPGDPHSNTTDQLLEMIDALARPGDKAVISALKDFGKMADVDQKEWIDRILERIE